MRFSNDFKDYELLDMASGEKLERWGDYILIRPDPQIIWNKKTNPKLWEKAHARYIRSSKGGGHWERLKKINDSWKVKYKDLTFNIKPMGFKHTGLFPEQATNWDYMINKISKEVKNGREVKVLNLFAYTGCASVACLKEGASVVHVDSSRGMVDWAKENVKVNNLEDKPIRFLVDDCLKFVEREIRRGNKYDAIIMDPPSFGRGTNKEVWSIDKDLFNLVSLCKNLLVDEPLFFIINTYTAGLSKIVIENILKIVMSGFPGKISSYELGILGKDNLILPCGVCARYEK